MTASSVLARTAVFAVAFGLLAWWMSRRKDLPAAGLSTFLGIAGVYTGFWGVMEHRRWLYAACVALILASYAIQFAARRRSVREDKETKAPDARPREE